MSVIGYQVLSEQSPEPNGQIFLRVGNTPIEIPKAVGYLYVLNIQPEDPLIRYVIFRGLIYSPGTTYQVPIFNFQFGQPIRVIALWDFSDLNWLFEMA